MSEKELGIVRDAIDLKVTVWVYSAVLIPLLPWVGVVLVGKLFVGSAWGWDGRLGFFEWVALAWIGITAPLWFFYSVHVVAAILEVRNLRASERADTGDSS